MKRIILFWLVAILLFSCRREDPVLVLVTDQLDAVTAAEIFNAGNHGFKIQIDFEVNLERALLNGKDGDIIIGKNINSPRLLNQFETLDEAILNSVSEVFLLSEPYSGKAVPLAFSTTTVVFPEDLVPELDDQLLLDQNDISKLIKGFNREKSGHWDRLGFSPIWSDLYLYQFIDSFKPRFQAGEDLQFSEENLDLALSALKNWIVSENGSMEEARFFDEKYRYIPDLLLINQNRILVTVLAFENFMQSENHDLSGLTFRFLSFDDFVYCRNTVFGAIPDDSDYKIQSEEFFLWLLKTENQEEIILFRQINRLPGFGIFQGLSTQSEVRKESFPEIYPDLFSSIPSDHYFRNEDIKDPRWESIKTQVLLPWVHDKLFNETELSLKEQYNDWLYYTIAE